MHIVYQQDLWITKNGIYPMPSEEQNCQHIVTVTGEEVNNSVKVVPRLQTPGKISNIRLVYNKFEMHLVTV